MQPFSPTDKFATTQPRLFFKLLLYKETGSSEDASHLCYCIFYTTNGSQPCLHHPPKPRTGSSSSDSSDLFPAYWGSTSTQILGQSRSVWHQALMGDSRNIPDPILGRWLPTAKSSVGHETARTFAVGSLHQPTQTRALRKRRDQGPSSPQPSGRQLCWMARKTRSG